MKIVQINTTCGVGSTGMICVGISRLLTEQQIENYILYSSKTNGYEKGISCSDDRYIKIQALKSRLFGNYGFNSAAATRKMIRELDRIQPDLVHLHNLHGHDCHLEQLFSYFKAKNIKLIWTFHDCWAFTGYCPHFAMHHCNKWQTTCSHCVQRREYSWLFDRSKQVFLRKKRLFEGLDLTIVAPSQWTADMAGQSFFKGYPVKVIYNGIDVSVFQPTANTFKEDHGIAPDKKIVLGVAFDWGPRKGLDAMIELATRLDPQQYQVVLVGTNDEVDKQLPPSILSIHRTQNQTELAKIYTAADVFVNPTREEVLGLTNIEANACGTPVVTFRTGGSPECIDESSGVVVEAEDTEAMIAQVVRICQTQPFEAAKCRERALRFDKNERFREYVRFYESFDIG
ncbi:MAG: glycosyltransferase [Ruminococcaceae bacterium]|nr:glycosyltransferase [Oscillospiraceae bacterium]